MLSFFSSPDLRRTKNKRKAEEQVREPLTFDVKKMPKPEIFGWLQCPFMGLSFHNCTSDSIPGTPRPQPLFSIRPPCYPTFGSSVNFEPKSHPAFRNIMTFSLHTRFACFGWNNNKLMFLKTVASIGKRKKKRKGEGCLFWMADNFVFVIVL